MVVVRKCSGFGLEAVTHGEFGFAYLTLDALQSSMVPRRGHRTRISLAHVKSVDRGPRGEPRKHIPRYSWYP